MPSSFLNVFFNGPRVFSEKDEPHESIRPHTRAMSFQDQGKSRGLSDPEASSGCVATMPAVFSSAPGLGAAVGSSAMLPRGVALVCAIWTNLHVYQG